MQSNKQESALQQYALVGARVRLAELEIERRQIVEMFPILKDALNDNRKPTAMPTNVVPMKRTAKRKPMSVAQRQAIRKRMLAYWTAKRDKKLTKKTA